MLVLSRREGEKIIIGDSVTLIVQRIGGNRVQLGVDAPRCVPVNRAELLEPNGRKRNQEETCGSH